MKQVVINGRHVDLPDTATDADIRRAGHIDPKRNVMQRTREGHFMVPKGSSMPVSDGDVFVDAPARVKGTEGEV